MTSTVQGNTSVVSPTMHVETTVTAGNGLGTWCVWMCLSICVCLCVCVCVCVYMCVSMYVYIYVCNCVCVCVQYACVRLLHAVTIDHINQVFIIMQVPQIISKKQLFYSISIVP